MARKRKIVPTVIAKSIIPLTDIAACASKANGRYAIAGALVTRGKWLVTTDGRTCAVAPCQMLDVEPQIVPTVMLTKGQQAKLSGESWTRPIRYKGCGATAHAMPVEGVFPPFGEVFPKDTKGRVWIALNAELLLNIARAVCENTSPQVVIGIGAPTKPIMVMATPQEASDPKRRGFGLLMPVSVAVRSGEQDHAAGWAACMKNLGAINKPAKH